jgi:MFS family permease
MSLYTLGIIASMGLGPTVAGWIEANPSLGWRWIQWVQVMCGVFFFPLILALTILLVSAGRILSRCFYL